MSGAGPSSFHEDGDVDADITGGRPDPQRESEVRSCLLHLLRLLAEVVARRLSAPDEVARDRAPRDE